MLTPPSPMVAAVARRLYERAAKQFCRRVSWKDAGVDHAYWISEATESLLAVLDNMDPAVMARAAFVSRNMDWDDLAPVIQEQECDAQRAAIAAVRAQMGETEGR